MLFVPRQYGTTEANSVTVSIERLDEIDETTGIQTEHPAEIVADYGDGRRVRWGIEDLRELTEMVLAVYDRDGCVAAVS